MTRDAIARQIVETLNRMLAADPKATVALLNYRVPVTRTLAADPTIQVQYELGHGNTMDSSDCSTASSESTLTAAARSASSATTACRH